MSPDLVILRYYKLESPHTRRQPEVFRDLLLLSVLRTSPPFSLAPEPISGDFVMTWRAQLDTPFQDFQTADPIKFSFVQKFSQIFFRSWQSSFSPARLEPRNCSRATSQSCGRGRLLRIWASHCGAHDISSDVFRPPTKYLPRKLWLLIGFKMDLATW